VLAFEPRHRVSVRVPSDPAARAEMTAAGASERLPRCRFSRHEVALAALGEEQNMTTLTKWSAKALSALCLQLLVSAGLAGCTPAMTAESPAGSGPVTRRRRRDPWPRQFTVGTTRSRSFQPQYESWQKARLDARSAVAVENPASPQPAYGVIWFTARTQIDKGDTHGRARGPDDLQGRLPTATEGGPAT